MGDRGVAPVGGEPVPSDGRGTVINLHYMRFVAAALVLWAHVGHEVSTYMGGGVERYANAPFDLGIGVDIFFVISGFVMMLTIRARPVSFGAFIRDRLIRVAPLYWLCTSVLLAVALLSPSVVTHGATDYRHVVASYLFVPWPRADGTVYPLFSLGWTLNFEMFFYMILGLGLVVARRRVASMVAGTLVLLVLLHPLTMEAWPQLRFWTRPILVEFLLGIGLAQLYRTGFSVRPWIAIAMIVGALVWASVTYRLELPYDWGRPVSQGLAAFVICAAAVGTEGRLPRNAVFKVVALAGTASYALYLVHPFVIRPMRLFARGPFVEWPLLYMIATVVAAFVASVLVHLFVEKPLTTMLRRWVAGKRDVRVADAIPPAAQTLPTGGR